MGGFTGFSSPAFLPNPGPIPVPAAVGDVLTVGAGNVPGFAAPSGGIPNASIFWCVAHRVALNTFAIDDGDGKITAAMWNRNGQGLFTLDLTSILTTGIFLVLPKAYPNVGNAQGYDAEVTNFATTGNFTPGDKKFAMGWSFWNGSAFAGYDPAYFGVFLLAK